MFTVAFEAAESEARKRKAAVMKPKYLGIVVVAGMNIQVSIWSQEEIIFHKRIEEGEKDMWWPKSDYKNSPNRPQSVDRLQD